MFNIGGGEFLVIAVIALVILGPQRLPEAAKQVGRAMGELRRLSSGFQNEMKGAFDEADRPTAPSRDVLGGGPPADVPSAASKAIDAVSDPTPGPRPRRRTPLRADPLPESTPPHTDGS
ncbi:MAG: Sec-independent protein translocase protein TatB [Acidimicrobiales bacterium]